MARTTEEREAYWKYLEEVAEQVHHWPKWMGGGGEEPICCPQCNQQVPKKTS